MFASMKEMGDILGVFVGHDHDDDYAVFWKGILLAYGRYTGGDTVYNNLSNGARVIEMTEGSTNFRTWIRQKDEEVINTVNYPSDFIKKIRPFSKHRCFENESCMFLPQNTYVLKPRRRCVEIQ